MKVSEYKNKRVKAINKILYRSDVNTNSALCSALEGFFDEAYNCGQETEKKKSKRR